MLNFENVYKRAFAVLSVALVFLLPILSSDAGFTDDERLHQEHGDRMLAYYTGTNDTAAMSPFDEKGKWWFHKEGSGSPRAMNVYGGFFDLVSSVLHKYIAPDTLDKYAFKHGMSALFGALLIILTGLLAYLISEDWRVALLALIIGALTPRLVGHSLNNPKDIPIATFFILGLVQIVLLLKELPVFKIRRFVFLALTISMAIAARSGSVILIGYLFLFAALVAGLQFKAREIDFKTLLKLAAITVVCGLVGYFASSLFWPWALQNPLQNPYKSIMLFKNFSGFNSIELFEARWINNYEIPWYFVPKWFYITFPVSLTVGFVLFFVFSPKILRLERTRVILHLFVIFSILFPMVTVILSKSNIYDDARHLIFIVPGFIVLAGSAWAYILKHAKGNLMKLTTGGLFIWMLYEPLAFMVRNHPLQVMYFSPFIDGAKGAFKNFEMDYWGFSVRKGLQWIEANDSSLNENHKARVRLWYGEQLKVQYFTDKSAKLQHVFAQENSTDWDYSIQLPVEAKFNNDLLFHWPPKGTVYQVMVDSVPLCAVIKNRRVSKVPESYAPPLLPAADVTSAADYTAKGLAYYKARNFNAALVEFKRGHLLDDKNLLSINNIVAALNELQMFDAALEYADKGLKIDPDYQLLINNREVSVKGKRNLKYDESYFIRMSYNYFIQKDFEKCISASRQILKYNPKSSIAYNNICSANNELAQYQKALEACNKGLQIVPNEQILKNNKAVAEKGLTRGE